MDDPDKQAYVQGIRDNEYNKKDHSYIVYEILKCQDSTRALEKEDLNCEDTEDKKCAMKYADPECESDVAEINKYIKTMTMHMSIINNKVDLSSIDNHNFIR